MGVTPVWVFDSDEVRAAEGEGLSNVAVRVTESVMLVLIVEEGDGNRVRESVLTAVSDPSVTEDDLVMDSGCVADRLRCAFVELGSCVGVKRCVTESTPVTVALVVPVAMPSDSVFVRRLDELEEDDTVRVSVPDFVTDLSPVGLSFEGEALILCEALTTTVLDADDRSDSVAVRECDGVRTRLDEMDLTRDAELFRVRDSDGTAEMVLVRENVSVVDSETVPDPPSVHVSVTVPVGTGAVIVEVLDLVAVLEVDSVSVMVPVAPFADSVEEISAVVV